MAKIEKNNTQTSGHVQNLLLILTLISILETDWEARLLACILGSIIVPMATVAMATRDSFCQCCTRRLSIKLMFISLFQQIL